MIKGVTLVTESRHSLGQSTLSRHIMALGRGTLLGMALCRGTVNRQALGQRTLSRHVMVQGRGTVARHGIRPRHLV